MAQEISVRRIC